MVRLRNDSHHRLPWWFPGDIRSRDRRFPPSLRPLLRRMHLSLRLQSIRNSLSVPLSAQPPSSEKIPKPKSHKYSSASTFVLHPPKGCRCAWIETAWNCGGCATAWIGVIAQGLELSNWRLNYAEGGARPARCRANESLGAACSGSDEYQVTSSGVLTRSSGAAASVGMCSAWQTWHAGSGPFVCW